MKPFETNKKKIRGWKKQVKKIDFWYENYRKINFENFNKKGEDWTKIRIAPWNRLCKRNPPQWYFRLILEKLFCIYFEWKKEYEKLEIPFDLQIWLHFPNSIRSEIVCAKVVKSGEKRNDYRRESKDKLSFPKQQWQSIKYNLNDFEWTLFDDEDFEFKNIFGLKEEEIQQLIAKGYIAEEIIIEEKAEIRYSKKVGYVWVGRMK